MAVPIQEPVAVIDIDEGLIDEAMKRQDTALIDLMDKMAFPVHAVTLASNGGYLLMCFSAEGKEGQCLAEYEPPSGLRLPIHTLLVDTNGRTARAIIRERASDAASG